MLTANNRYHISCRLHILSSRKMNYKQLISMGSSGKLFWKNTQLLCYMRMTRPANLNIHFPCHPFCFINLMGKDNIGDFSNFNTRRSFVVVRTADLSISVIPSFVKFSLNSLLSTVTPVTF